MYLQHTLKSARALGTSIILCFQGSRLRPKQSDNGVPNSIKILTGCSSPVL